MQSKKCTVFLSLILGRKVIYRDITFNEQTSVKNQSHVKSLYHSCNVCTPPPPSSAFKMHTLLSTWTTLGILIVAKTKKPFKTCGQNAKEAKIYLFVWLTISLFHCNCPFDNENCMFPSKLQHIESTRRDQSVSGETPLDCFPLSIITSMF